MVNYFNFKELENEYLITNDFGRYQFVDKKALKTLVKGDESSLDSALRDDLTEKFFLTGESRQAFLDKSVPYMRNMKFHLFQSTGLFIFVMTNSCNLNCVYCQAQSESSSTKGLMSKEIAEKGIDIALQSPLGHITVEFQGGEPLLNFDVIKHIIEYADTKKGNKAIAYNLVSNLSLLTDEIADYLAEHKVQVSVSLDGNEIVHNSNRPFRQGGSGSYNTAIKGIKMLRDRNMNLGAIQTTTRFSLDHAEEIVDTYLELGFNNIFIRPLTKLGYANDHWEKIGYTPDEFLAFYKRALNHILEVNANGTIFSEGHANIFLTKILQGYSSNYMELRSPCGAAVGQIAIYYDGNIYTCDEGRMVAEMGDPAFKMGDVFSSDYNSIIDCGVCKTVCTASCLESIPGCCDCVYQPYCGVCPVINYAVDNDLFAKAPRNNRCKIYAGMLDYCFSVLHKNDKNVIAILERWIQ